MLPEPGSLVLVAVMKQPRDLEIARLHGWYRIPLRSAPKVILVDYLAFYQTGSFDTHKWQIQYFAAVKGHELAKRAELIKDEADHPFAGHEYYKIQLGPLTLLPRPILAKKWRRITFFYTTGEYLLEAETINDLIVAEDERRSLWQALRERAEKYGHYNVLDLPELDVHPDVLAFLLGVEKSS
ncbi:MAG: hypothetical protein JSV61_13505 [Anaerolineales bacterium]|nr:MAG: hypothetical protein JSV61_13505 [Anaerolineales bacterium]